MRTLSLLALLHTTTLLGAQSTGTPITIGEVQELKSNVLGETRPLYIGLPPGYATSDERYPVVILLDAESRFELARAVQQYFVYSTRVPHTILLGVPNPSREARERDLLPESAGGSPERFTQFLTDELLPYLDATYRTDSVRILAGHSHGGVFTVSTLLRHPELFAGYIATDPSYGLLKSADSLLTTDLSGRRLYTCSSDGAYGFNEEISSDMRTNHQVFRNLLVRHASNGLIYTSEHIADDHGNAFITGFHRGLRYVFGWPIE